MKNSFIILVICVVVSLALPEGNRSVNSDLKEQDQQQQQQQQEFVSTHEPAVANDELIDSRNENVDEKIIASSNQIAAEGDNRSSWIRRRHNRRQWLRNGEGITEGNRGRNCTGSNKGERRHLPMFSSIRQESQTLLPGNAIGMGRHHHRHHHHHHHHKNRTTTTTTTTTAPTETVNTTPTMPLSEMEEIALYRHLTPN